MHGFPGRLPEGEAVIWIRLRMQTFLPERRPEGFLFGHRHAAETSQVEIEEEPEWQKKRISWMKVRSTVH